VSRRITQEALLDSLDTEISWRRIELSALKTALNRATGPAEDTAARAAVALAYAHWEGYVVTVSRSLLRYVMGLRLKYGELSDPYLALCLAGRLVQADASIRRIRRHIDVVTMLRGLDDQAAFPSPERSIQAEGNLKSEKFDDIVTRLGLNAEPFELHYNWLDAELLRRRNSITHGAGGDTDAVFGSTALETVNDLLDRFRTAIQNGIALEVFRRQ
jgi:hypothetical protein